MQYIESLPSGCNKSEVCKYYAELKPLMDKGLKPKCPYLIELTKDVDILRMRFPKGKITCIESLKELIPDLLGTEPI